MITTASLLYMGVLITNSDVAAYSEITRIVMEPSAYLLGPSLEEEEEEELMMDTDNKHRS